MQLRRRTWGNYLAQGLEPTKLVVPKLLSAVCCLLSAVAVAVAALAIRFAVRPRNGNRDARQSNGEWAVGEAFTIHDSYGHDRHDRQARVVDRVA